jgi:hypothetical protein
VILRALFLFTVTRTVKDDMTTPQINIFDALTGKTITRDYNETELAQLEADQAQAKKDAAAKTKADKAAADKRQSNYLTGSELLTTNC